MTGEGLFSFEFLRAMAEKEVEALLIGRQAMAVYGAPTATNDLDVLVVSKKAERILGELAESFGLVKVLEEERGMVWKRRQVRYTDDPEIPSAAGVWPRVVDILTIPRMRGFAFETAWRRRVPIKLETGGAFFVPHIDDLIVLKRRRNSDRDKEDIAWLKRHRREIVEEFPGVGG
ncbi:MAG: hypothetical protein D6679_04885 [Candidatus Hydrogenedentota bacterium]|nr:MAG: hypothetical protein D6679_04885 [Candidatus Hydrogenedentota bacterium]